MRKKILLLYLILSITSVFSQKNEDYHQNIVETTKSNSLKLASLDSLISDVKNQKNLNLFADRTEQYIDLAIELEQYKNAARIANRSFYNINIRLNQKKRALSIIEKIERFKDKIDDSYLIGSIYARKGNIYSQTKKRKKAIENYTLSINTFKKNKKDSIEKANTLQDRGHQYFDTGNFLKATEDYKLAAKYYENLGNIQYMFYAFSNMINVYSANGFNQKAIDERKKLIELKISKKTTTDLYSDYYNQSIAYKKLDSFKNQEKCLLESYRLLEIDIKNNLESYHDDDKLVITSSLSKYYSLDKNLKKAKKYLTEAEILYKKSTKRSYYKYIFLDANANFSFNFKKNIEAKKYALEASEIANKIGLIEGIMESEKLLSEIHNTKGNKELALISFKNYTKIKDSIFSVTKTNALSYYQTLYETERKEKEIQKQQTEINTLAKENNAKQRLLLFGSIAVGLLFLVFYLYRNRQQENKKRKMQEEYSQKLLLSQEDERKRISKDLHDSLGQSLLLIKNKVALKEDNTTKELINNAIEEMRGIARVLHPFQLENIGISRALENLIFQLDENYAKTYIFGDIDDIKNILNQNEEVNIFRIVQECLSNIIKHANAASAKISLIQTEKSIIINIKDNGIGFDFSEKYNDFKSLGLKTIKERVKFLKGTLKIDSVKNEGTTFTIQIPK